MAWRCITSADAGQTLILSHKACALETMVFNTRGTGSFKVYDCNDESPTNQELFADFDLANSDLLIQYLGSGVELDEGLVVVVPEDPGNITICWKEITQG